MNNYVHWSNNLTYERKIAIHENTVLYIIHAKHN